MSEVPRFEPGEHWRDSREKLNRIVDALNALRRMEGDEIVAVNREGDNLLLDTSIDQISARLPQRQFLYAKITTPKSGDGDGWWNYGATGDLALCYGQRCDIDGNVQSSESLTLSYYHSPATDPNIRQGDVVPYDSVCRHIMGHYDDDKIDTIKIWHAADVDKDIPPGWEEVSELDGRVPVGPGGVIGDDEIDSGAFGNSGGDRDFTFMHDHGVSDSNAAAFQSYSSGPILHTLSVDTPTSGPSTADGVQEPPFYTVRFIRRVD